MSIIVLFSAKLVSFRETSKYFICFFSADLVFSLKTLRTHTPCTAPSFYETPDEEEWWEKVYMSEPMQPYTIEEIDAMIDAGERDFAEGRYRDARQAIADLRAEFARRDAKKSKLELDLAESRCYYHSLVLTISRGFHPRPHSFRPISTYFPLVIILQFHRE